MSETTKYALGPTVDEILEALAAGFVSIDDGHGFQYGFENSLTASGYQQAADSPCNCPDQGWHGHLPECRWLRDWPNG